MPDELIVCGNCGQEIDPDSDFTFRMADGVLVHHAGECPGRVKRGSDRRVAERRLDERRGTPESPESFAAI